MPPAMNAPIRALLIHQSLQDVRKHGCRNHVDQQIFSFLPVNGSSEPREDEEANRPGNEYFLVGSVCQNLAGLLQRFTRGIQSIASDRFI
jgi:hypothetical protein